MTGRSKVTGAAFAALAILVWRAAGMERASAERLLLIDGRPVHWVGDRGMVVTTGGIILEVRGDVVQQLDLAAGPRPIIDGIPAADGGAWLVDGGGTILYRTAAGEITERGRSPLDIPALADDGRTLWVVRSPMQFTFRPETTGAPMGLRLAHDLTTLGSTDSARIPGNPFLTQLANAAHVIALEDGGAVIAPFIRDEVTRVDRDGGVVWRISRGLSHQTPDPAMTVERRDGRPEVVVDYAPVNLALVRGAGGSLFVLSTVAARTDSSRLDALDLESGALLNSWRFGTALPTIVSGPGPVAREADAAGVRAAEPAGAAREPFTAFALSGPAGDSLRLADLRGRVTVVNFWASWCLPCRTEFPALDSLAGTFDTSRVVFVALSDDVSRAAARRFLESQPAPHTRIGFGDGRLKRTYRFLGLPATALVDADGRLVRWWIGYTGPQQLLDLAQRINAELGVAQPEAPSGHHGH